MMMPNIGELIKVSLVFAVIAQFALIESLLATNKEQWRKIDYLLARVAGLEREVYGEKK